MREELERFINSENEYGKPTNTEYFIRSTLAKEIIKTPTALKSNSLEKSINKRWLNKVQSRIQRSETLSDLCFDGGYDFYNYLSKQDIKDGQSLRIAIEHYQVPSIPVLNNSLQNVFQRYTGSEVYKVPQADGTFKYLITTDALRIVILDEYGNKVSETTDTEVIEALNKMVFKQVYLGLNLNIFLNIPLNNISELELYLKCKSIEQLKTISNQHNIIDNVAHADMSDTSMVSADSLESDKAGQAEQAEQAGQAEQAEQAERTYNSHNASTANIADDLTDKAIEKVVESFTDSIVNGDKKEILDAIEQKIFEKQQERREKEKWSYPVSVYTQEFETLDVYRNETLENANKHLANSHRLLIIGSTGDGKTELAYYMAHKLTGENIGANRDSSYFNRICIGSARDARPIYTEKTSEYIGKLNRFIKHIKDNNITEPCVFICNEIQASDIGYILGENLWEEFNNSGISEILPDNLYLIFTGCKDRDFGIDSQILQRIPSVEIGYISSNYEDKHEKMLKAFDGVNDNLIDILKLVEDINDTEGYPIISMRKFKDILTGKPFDLGLNDESILSSETIRALDKLREQYGN